AITGKRADDRGGGAVVEQNAAESRRGGIFAARRIQNYSCESERSGSAGGAGGCASERHKRESGHRGYFPTLGVCAGSSRERDCDWRESRLDAGRRDS